MKYRQGQHAHEIQGKLKGMTDLSCCK